MIFLWFFCYNEYLACWCRSYTNIFLHNKQIYVFNNSSCELIFSIFIDYLKNHTDEQILGIKNNKNNKICEKQIITNFIHKDYFTNDIYYSIIEEMIMHGKSPKNKRLTNKYIKLKFKFVDDNDLRIIRSFLNNNTKNISYLSDNQTYKWFIFNKNNDFLKHLMIKY